jgi:hypothetical protein
VDPAQPLLQHSKQRLLFRVPLQVRRQPGLVIPPPPLLFAPVTRRPMTLRQSHSDKTMKSSATATLLEQTLGFRRGSENELLTPSSNVCLLAIYGISSKGPPIALRLHLWVYLVAIQNQVSVGSQLNQGLKLLDSSILAIPLALAQQSVRPPAPRIRHQLRPRRAAISLQARHHPSYRHPSHQL